MLQCKEINWGHPTFFCQLQGVFRTKESGYGCFRTNHNRGKIILLVWARIDAKGYANVHFNVYLYGEMTFIFVNGETSKRQEKQLFANWRPVTLKTKQSRCKICFTAWRPRSLNTKQTRHKCFLLNESRECWWRKRLNTKMLLNDGNKKGTK